MADYLERLGYKKCNYILQMKDLCNKPILYIAKNNAYTPDWEYALTFFSEDEAYARLRKMFKDKGVEISIEKLKINPKVKVINFIENPP